jgi:hypothetical protein
VSFWVSGKGGTLFYFPAFEAESLIFGFVSMTVCAPASVFALTVYKVLQVGFIKVKILKIRKSTLGGVIRLRRYHKKDETHKIRK